MTLQLDCSDGDSWDEDEACWCRVMPCRGSLIFFCSLRVLLDRHILQRARLVDRNTVDRSRLRLPRADGECHRASVVECRRSSIAKIMVRTASAARQCHTFAFSNNYCQGFGWLRDRPPLPIRNFTRFSGGYPEFCPKIADFCPLRVFFLAVLKSRPPPPTQNLDLLHDKVGHPPSTWEGGLPLNAVVVRLLRLWFLSSARCTLMSYFCMLNRCFRCTLNWSQYFYSVSHLPRKLHTKTLVQKFWSRVFVVIWICIYLSA